MMTVNKPLINLIVAALLGFGFYNVALAQDDDVIESLKILTANDKNVLRKILIQPLNSELLFSTLKTQVTEKLIAANKLGDIGELERVTREAITVLPNEVYLKHNLANYLVRKGAYEEAEKLFLTSIELQNNVGSKLLYFSNLINLHYQNRDLLKAKEILTKAYFYEKSISKSNLNKFDSVEFHRGKKGLFYYDSLIEEMLGNYSQSITLSKKSIDEAEIAYKFAIANQNQENLILAQITYVSALRRHFSALRVGGRINEASQALSSFFNFLKKENISDSSYVTAYQLAAQLKIEQRAFLEGLSYIEKSLNYLPKSSSDTLLRQEILLRYEKIRALIGLKRYTLAAKEFEYLDEVGRTNASMRSRILYRPDRGFLEIQANNNLSASKWLSDAVNSYTQRFGINHVNTIQARGLHGVALWRVSTPESRAQAITLLREAVRDYIDPKNADFIDNIGLRKEYRELIFSTYIDAAAQISDQDAANAMGAADWLMAGSVQEALSDAANRAAVSDSSRNPALAEAVRRDQDAKNEIRALRDYLSGGVGGNISPLPKVAHQMRERIATLEGKRAMVQAQIKTSYPQYEQLVRPVTPSTAQVIANLKPHEALLLLLPSDKATYVWAVTADKPVQFYRAPAPHSQVQAWVQSMRKTLDLGISNSIPPFDSVNSQALYAQLIAPIALSLANKTHWIIATNGVLAQIPFAVLQTKNTTSSQAWLIDQTAITQVPSVSAWLAISQLAKRPTAEQPLAAWGDPVFDLGKPLITLAPSAKRSVVLVRDNSSFDLDAPQLPVFESAIQYKNVPPLPETRDELLAIANILKAPISEIHLGLDASRASVLAANASGRLQSKRVIAFATHGLMSGDLPDLNQPALALSATGNESAEPLSALLTLEDVLTLKLNADWVVLSACNTAAADGKAEETLSGLARGFFYAGSRSLLVTHWAVESESAKQLTTATFEHYSANPLADKSESLRQAMLKIKANPQYSHPAYWAAYALVGDGGR